ncbi:MAG TPA: OmpA family protein [Polyangiaceae bacterium]|jgi:OOP family OmpA-OmpF porin|nr:OmpA family protein [Polyangiaceae bacterium]
MRKLVAPVLCTAVAVLSFAVAGCSVKVQAGAADEPKPTPVAKPAPTATAKPKLKPKLNLKGLRKVGNEIELPAPVPFKTGSAELDTDAGADEILELVRQYMVANPDTTLLRIEGHTDSDGDDASNQTLSEQRAWSVTKWLVQHGVDCKRLIAVGFGESRPLVPNDTAENKAKNRRVSFFDAAVKGEAVKDAQGKKIPMDNGGKIAGDPCAAK